MPEVEMSQAQALKDKYEADLVALQAKCSHERTVWSREAWAPAHYTGFEIERCRNCWKAVSKRSVNAGASTIKKRLSNE